MRNRKSIFNIKWIGMNKIVLFVVTVFCLPALGQKISFEQNGIYGKDSLEQRKMEFREFDLQGKDRT